MTDYQKYINALRKCATEHDNDRTFTGHIVVSDLCRDTANLLEELEQEPILDKIRAEIEKEADTSNRLYGISEIGLRKALKILDKYKGEMRNDD